MTSLAEQVTRAEGQRILLRGQIEDSERRQQGAAAAAELGMKIGELLLQVEQAWRRSFEQRVSGKISQGLTAVFGDDIRIGIETTTVRGVTSMKLMLKQNGVELGNIVDGTGGSIVALLDVLLWARLLVSVDPPLRRFMVLDEPFKMIEQRHLPAVGQLLREMSRTLGIQWIIASHEPELMDVADAVFEVQTNGTIKQIKTAEEDRSS